MARRFAMRRQRCNCACSCTGDYIITTEQIGSGYVVCIADGNVVSPCVAGSNDDLLNNIHSLAGGGTVACAGDAARWANLPFTPTVTNVDDVADLASAALMIEGVHDNPATPVSPPVTDFYELSGITGADYLTWVSGGGVLVLVGEHTDDTITSGDAGGIANAAFNAILEGLGSEIRFKNEYADFGCASPASDTYGWPACPNWLHPLYNGTTGTRAPDIWYTYTSLLCGGTWLAKRYQDPCEFPCDPPINPGELGVIYLEGTLGGVAFRACLSEDVSITTGLPIWVGSVDDDDVCSGTLITFTLFCDIGPPHSWKLLVSDGTNSVTLDVTVSSGDPLSGTVSGTLTGICGGAALDATLAPCEDPPEYPCCNGSLTDAERCCLEIPSLYVWHEYTYEVPTSGGPVLETVEVSGTFVWDAADNRWEGTLDWTTDGAGCGSPGSTSWTDAVITCGYTLASSSAGVSYGSSTYPCPIGPGGFEVPDVVNPIRCVTPQTKTLKFFPSPLLSPEP